MLRPVTILERHSPHPARACRRESPSSPGEGLFSDAAIRLAGFAGAMLGWRPGEFWDATPAELAAVFAALNPVGEPPPDGDALARLKEMFPDG